MSVACSLNDVTLSRDTAALSRLHPRSRKRSKCEVFRRLLRHQVTSHGTITSRYTVKSRHDIATSQGAMMSRGTSTSRYVTVSRVSDYVLLQNSRNMLFNGLFTVSAKKEHEESLYTLRIYNAFKKCQGEGEFVFSHRNLIKLGGNFFFSTIGFTLRWITADATGHPSQSGAPNVSRDLKPRTSFQPSRRSRDTALDWLEQLVASFVVS